MLDFGGMEGMEGWGWRKTGWMEGPRVEVEMSQELGVRVSEQNSWAASRSVVRCDRHISFDQGWCALQVVLYSRSARNGNGMTFSRWLLQLLHQHRWPPKLCHHEYRPNLYCNLAFCFSTFGLMQAFQLCAQFPLPRLRNLWRPGSSSCDCS